MMKKEFKIIVSLASTHVEYANKRSKNCIEKVVCSVMYYDESINLNNLINNSAKQFNTMNYKNFMVINLGRYLSYDPLVRIDLKNLKFIDLNIYRFLKIISKNISNIYRRELEELESVRSEKSNKFDSKFYFKLSSLININLSFLFETENNRSIDRKYNLIFIFNDITWKNIVFLFKLYGVELYGGSSNKRHLLSTVHVNLVNFLLLMNNNELDYNLIYKSFNSIDTYESKIDRELLKYIQSGEHMKLLKLIKNPAALCGNEFPLDSYNYDSIEEMKRKTLIKDNLFLIVYTSILISHNEINLIEGNISRLLLEIKEDKERYKKYSKFELNNYYLKKIKSIEKRNSINNSKYLELNNEIKKLRERSNGFINILKELDSTYFDKEGICKIDSSIRVLNTTPTPENDNQGGVAPNNAGSEGNENNS
jgi:hypothetical protein